MAAPTTRSAPLRPKSASWLFSDRRRTPTPMRGNGLEPLRFRKKTSVIVCVRARPTFPRPYNRNHGPIRLPSTTRRTWAVERLWSPSKTMSGKTAISLPISKRPPDRRWMLLSSNSTRCPFAPKTDITTAIGALTFNVVSVSRNVVTLSRKRFSTQSPRIIALVDVIAALLAAAAESAALIEAAAGLLTLLRGSTGGVRLSARQARRSTGRVT